MADLTATRKVDCSGSRNTVYKPQEMWVEKSDGVLLDESMLFGG
jgi:hypothetical protein